MEKDIIKIELPNTPKAKKALEAFKKAMAEKHLEHQEKAAEYASKIKKPAV